MPNWFRRKPPALKCTNSLMKRVSVCSCIATLGVLFPFVSESRAQNEKPAPSSIRAGAAAVNITPAPGIGLAGYYFERGADGTNDDLFAKALVLEAGGTKAALVTLD